MNDIVSQVEKYNRGWTSGLPETPCGYGSTLQATEEQREWIPFILRKHGIRTVADVGAGDLNWMQCMNLPPGVFYQAYDLVPRHADVKSLDILADPIPKADMILLLWVLNHFPKEHAARAWGRVLDSGSHFCLITDRPTWRNDHPECLRDLPYIDRLVLNKKNDQILLVELC